MNRPHTFLAILLFVLSGLTACHKPGCLESAGAQTSVERRAAPFRQIDLYDNIDLVLTQSSVEKIRVEAGADLQPNIVTGVANGVLTIQNTTSCTWLRSPSEKVRVYVSFKTLDLLNYNGSGHVSSTDTLKVPELEVSSETGAGNVELTVQTQLLRAFIDHENADFIIRGVADECHAYTNSRGTLDLSELQVRRYNIRYGALKDTYIRVSERLEVEIYFKGNVYYKGDPQITTIYHDTGRLIKVP
jgi:hypothetical protein